MSLLKKASIITTPTAYAEDYLYSIKPAQFFSEELVTNGNFNNGSSNWSLTSEGTITTDGANLNNLIGGAITFLQQNNVTVIGRKYKLEYYIRENNSGSLKFNTAENPNLPIPSTVGVHTLFFTASLTEIIFARLSGSTDITIDNISIVEVTDADFDFDRNSTGTRVNQDYLIEDVPYNLAPYSESFSTWALSNATLTANSETSPDGQNNATLIKDDTTNNRHGVFKTFSSGQSVRTSSYSIYLKNKDRRYAVVTINGTDADVYYGVVVDLETGAVTQENASNVTLQSYKVSAVGNGWYRVCITANLSYRYLTIATSNASTFTPIAYGYNSYTGDNKGFYIWGAQLVKGDKPKDYLKTTDRLDIPRIDYTNGEPSILLEPQSTNQLLNSNDISQMTTIISGGSITLTGNYAASPDGTQNATRVFASSTGSGYALVSSSAVTSTAGNYTGSIYLKSNNGSNQNVAIYGRNSVVTYATITPNWERYNVLGSASSNFINLGARTSFGSDESLDFLAWGMQIEHGDFATSLIHTSGSAVTRSADAANNAGNSDLINSTEGVLYCEINSLTQTLGSSDEAISISDGTLDNRIQVYHKKNLSNTIAYGIESGNAIQFFVSVAIADISLPHKVAIKYKANDCALWIDGNEVDTQTSVSMPSGLNELQFASGNGASQFYGNTKSVMVFKEALTDLELEKLTGYNNHELYMNYYNRLSYLGLVEEYNVESDINNYIL